MHPKYESELSYWGVEEEQGSMFIPDVDEQEQLDILMERYNKLLAELGSLRKAEPSRKHSAESKSEYELWIRRTHDLRDELNVLAEAIRGKCRG